MFAWAMFWTSMSTWVMFWTPFAPALRHGGLTNFLHKVLLGPDLVEPESCTHGLMTLCQGRKAMGARFWHHRTRPWIGQILNDMI